MEETVFVDRPDVALLYRSLVVWEAAAVLRHDLRNKLASVRNAGFYLRRKVERDAGTLWEGDPRVPKFFELIGLELDAAEAILVERLPGLAKPSEAPGVSLGRAAADALAHLRVPAGVAVTLPRDDLATAGDRGEITVAVFCLLENAIEAVTPAGGTVTVTLRAEPERAVVEVADDGPGLAAEPRRVLEHFFTTKPGRLGLGLKIARRIAQRARGSLELGSGGERGASARLALPLGGTLDGAMHDPLGR